MKTIIGLIALTAIAFAKPPPKKHYNSFTNRHGELRSSSIEANEPTLCDSSVKQYSGYFDAGSGGREYFYWFFESRNDPSTDPLVLWLTGGPGCSSILALLTENGPCYVNDAGDDTYLSSTSWNSKANALWVDQPPGTGFSKGVPDTNEEQVGQDMYTFLQNFITAYPDYFKNGFYIFGESYAGHYVPAISYEIYSENKAGTGTNIPLQAFAIGNGMTDPYIQFEYYAQMAYNSTTADHVITETTYNRMVTDIPECQSEILKCNQGSTTECDDAYNYCLSTQVSPVERTGVNPYNLDIPCQVPGLCYNFTNVGIWLNNKTVQSQLGVDKTWEDCSTYVNELFESDWMVDYQTKIPPMLDDGNIRGLIYAGDLDFICNYLGNQAWALALNWTNTDNFNKAPVKQWSDSTGTACGNLREYGMFHFFQVFNAGHMVPRDQPQCALAMMEAWLANTLIN